MAEAAEKKRIEIDGIGMAYRDEGEGAPIVFLHGNPTSSYLWRNIIPHVAGLGRALAPDLVGMGDSDKLPDSGPDRYTFVEHRHYLDGFLDAVIGPDEKITFVVHDWGSALGFHWAHRNPDRVRGIAFMEGIVGPVPSWDDFPQPVRPVFEGFRSPAGEEMVLQKNVFVENVLTGAIMRTLTDEEMAEYRRPFLEPGESRRPTLTWPRQIPIAGEPADVHEIVSAYAAWLPSAPFPKLFVNADPGALIRGPVRDFIRGWQNLTEATVSGVHFIQEDSPDEIGMALRGWMESALR